MLCRTYPYRDWETKIETGGKEDIYSITNNLTGNSVGGGFTKAKTLRLFQKKQKV